MTNMLNIYYHRYRMVFNALEEIIKLLRRIGSVSEVAIRPSRLSWKSAPKEMLFS